jgi:hypothetical protein
MILTFSMQKHNLMLLFFLLYIKKASFFYILYLFTKNTIYKNSGFKAYFDLIQGCFLIILLSFGLLYTTFRFFCLKLNIEISKTKKFD